MKVQRFRRPTPRKNMSDSFDLYPDGTIVAWYEDYDGNGRWGQVYPTLEAAMVPENLQRYMAWKYELADVDYFGCTECESIVPFDDPECHASDCPVWKAFEGLVTSSLTPDLQREMEQAEAPEKEKDMEKYGAELEDKEKTGADSKPLQKCPACGADLDNGGACPKHGTEPFEKRQQEKKP